MLRAIDPTESVLRDGFAVVPGVIGSEAIADLITAVERAYDGPTTLKRGGSVFGMRDLLDRVPEVRQLAGSEAIRLLVEPILGHEARVVRGLWFDRTAEAN